MSASRLPPGWKGNLRTVQWPEGKSPRFTCGYRTAIKQLKKRAKQLNLRLVQLMADERADGNDDAARWLKNKGVK